MGPPAFQRMPGVPSGRGCDACRKQKKKCDQQQPTCSRCLRLKLTCVGAGIQRYKFQQDKRFPHPTTKAKNASRNNEQATATTLLAPCPQYASSSAAIVSRETRFQHIYIHVPPGTTLSNELTGLTTAFVRTIKRSTDLRYNLWWSFGSFLEDVPRRLGTNEALDRAVDALTTGHNDFCVTRAPSVKALAKYSQALHTLRVYLDDPVHAQTSTTLAAVMILLICQMFLGQLNQCWSGHAEGAAIILKARKHFGPRDPFETKLFLSLRGSVLFEGLFNDRINLTSEEWAQLVTNDLDTNTPDGEMLYSLSHAPALLQRARITHQSDNDPTQVRDEIWSIYQNCKETLSRLKARSVEPEMSAIPMKRMSPGERDLVAQFTYSHYQRTYGIGLAITLFYNCMLSALGGTDAITAFDAEYLGEEVIALAEQSNMYRPIGTGYLSICLVAAWAATMDQSLRDRIMGPLVEYTSDFRLRDSRYMRSELEWTAEHLRLGTPFRVSGEGYAIGT